MTSGSALEWRWRELCAAVARGIELDSELPKQTSAHSDWRPVFQLARRHEVSMLASVGFARLPDAHKGEHDPSLGLKPMRRALRQAGDTKVVLAVLAEAGVDNLVLKGLPLAQQAYAALHMRATGDIDVLVRPRDRTHAEAALAGLGYRRVPHPEIPTQGFPRSHDPVHSGFAYRSPGRSSLVDLQWRLSATDRLSGLRVDDALARSVAIDLAGVPARTLAPNEHYLYVVSHAAKHRFSRLKWIADIAALRRQVDMAWVRAEAERRGQSRIHQVAEAVIDETLLGRSTTKANRHLIDIAHAALATSDRLSQASVLERERYLIGLQQGPVGRAHVVAWRARRALHSLRWSH